MKSKVRKTLLYAGVAAFLAGIGLIVAGIYLAGFIAGAAGLVVMCVFGDSSGQPVADYPSTYDFFSS